jgi:hypothetical protein
MGVLFRLHFNQVNKRKILTIILCFYFILLDEQERVQKKTFTKWVNIYLSLHEPPLYVNDLFEDFQDGTKLIALLEVLSGQTLVCLDE